MANEDDEAVKQQQTSEVESDMSSAAQELTKAVDEMANKNTSKKATKSNGKTKTAKVKTAKVAKPKREKKVKAAKAEKKPLEGPITGVKASGETYLQVEFGSGHVTLTPTSNRVFNRDLVVKCIRSLIS